MSTIFGELFTLVSFFLLLFIEFFELKTQIWSFAQKM